MCIGMDSIHFIVHTFKRLSYSSTVTLPNKNVQWHSLLVTQPKLPNLIIEYFGKCISKIKETQGLIIW